MREDLLSSIRARTIQFAGSGNSRVILDADALAEAGQLFALTEDPDHDLEICLAVGMLHWSRYQALGQEDGKRDLALALALLGTVARSDPGAVPEPVRAQTGFAVVDQSLGAPDLNVQLDLGGQLLARFQRTGRISDLDQAIAILRRSLMTVPAGHDHAVRILALLDDALYARYQGTGEPGDLDRLIRHLREAMGAVAASDPSYPVFAANLDNALYTHYLRTGALAALEEVITLRRRALQARPPGDSAPREKLSALANVLIERYEHAGAVGDLAEAEELLRRSPASRDSDADGQLKDLYLLGILLRKRHERAPDPDALDESVTVMTRVVAMALKHGRSEYAAFSGSLANTLHVRYQSTGDLDDLYRAVHAYRQAAKAARDDDRAKVECLANLGSMLRLVYERTQEPAAVAESISVTRQAIAAARADDPERGWYLANLGSAFWARWERDGNLDDLDEVIGVRRRSVAVTGDQDQAKAKRLSNLANALQARHGNGGSPAMLDEAIQVREQVVALTRDDQPDRATYLSYLSSARWARYEATSDRADLDAAITARRGALASRFPDDSADDFFWLGRELFECWLLDSEPALLDEAVDRLRTAVAGTPARHPDLVGRLSVLAGALSKQHDQSGDPAMLDEMIKTFGLLIAHSDPAHEFVFGVALAAASKRTSDPALLDRAITVVRNSVAATPADHHDLAERLFHLGTLLWQRYHNTGDAVSLGEALTAHRQAVDAAPYDQPDRPEMLSALAGDQKEQFMRTGDSSVLDEAIASLEAALAAAGDDDARARYLSNLGGAWQMRFNRTGELAALQEAIEAGRAALAATPGVPQHGALANLGGSLRFWFERTGDVQVLDEAIGLLRAAVGAGPGQPAGQARDLSNLGAALRRRFDRTGELTALVEAIDVGRRAVAATPEGQLGWPARKSNLGSSLRAWFERTGEVAALEEAVRSYREALRALPEGHPDQAQFQSNLAGTLQMWSEREGDISALHDAIGLFRAAAGSSASRPQRAMYLANLGGALHVLAERTGDAGALADVTGCLRQAVEWTPEGDITEAGYLINLGSALRLRFAHHQDQAFLREALGAYQAAARLATAPPQLRVQAAAEWGSLGMLIGSGQEALAGFSAAVELLPQLVTRELQRGDAEHWLRRFAGIASDAAACAVQAGDPERALVLLEQGRGVLLAQALDTHDDLTELREHSAGARALADRFRLLGQNLDDPRYTGHLSRPALFADPGVDEAGQAMTDPAVASEAAERRRELAAELEEIADRIRQIPGFDRFLLPPAVDELKSESRCGPIAVINVSRYRCDALILAAGQVRAIPLDRLSAASVRERADAFLAAVDSEGSGQTPGEGLRAQEAISDILGWLWDAVAQPVLGELGLIRSPGPEEEWPRIWWIPTGRLSFLPLHAAGHHGDNDRPGPHTTLDCLVSSYAPTIRTLAHARVRPLGGDAATAPLIVAMTQTPDAQPLPGAGEEAGFLAARFPTARVLAGEQATHDEVLAELPGRPWVHFACHCVSGGENPSASSLLVHDHKTQPLNILEISRLRLRQAELAYLSACSTTRTSPGLADEAVHLTSGFQLAGYRHVIGTLWTINDRVAVKISAITYDAMTGDKPDPGLAPFAVHRAAREIRRQFPLVPSLWASHIHAGI